MPPPNLESWLRRRPRPAELRIVIAGQARSMPLGVVRSWAAVAQSIAASSAEVVEAIGPSGELLRVLNPEQLDQLETEPSPVTHDVPPAPPLTGAAAVNARDPETARFELFARLISDAYRHSTEVAFSRMVDLFEAVNTRHETIEKSLDRAQKMITKLVEDQLDNAQPQEQGDILGDMAKSFMGGLTQEAPKPNGKQHS